MHSTSKHQMFAMCFSSPSFLSPLILPRPTHLDGATTPHTFPTPSLSPLRQIRASIPPPPDIPLPPNLLSVAHAAVDAAAIPILKYFRSPLPIDYKSDHSPVTAADRAAETAIRAVILRAFPTHAVVGEEQGGLPDADFIWVVDPIDGTRAFITGKPTFTTLIAVLHKGTPVLGIINQPVSRERWVGIAGAPTTLNGDVVGVRTPPKLNECVLQASTPDMFLGVDAIAFRKVVASAKNVVYGGDAYSYALLASGCADVVVEADLKVWDFMALVPVLQGAGAVIGDWMGFPLGLESDGRVVAAASSTLFTEVTDLIGALDELNLSPESSFVSRPFLTKDVLPDDPGLGHVESMTGFGMSVVETEGYTITAQIRSVNSRYCTVQVRGPKCILPFESSIVAIIKKAAVRGKILANLEIVSSPSDIDAIPVVVDRAAVKAARKMLDTIAQEAGIDEKPHLADIMNFSEVLTKLDEDSMVKVALQVTIQAVSEAVENMREARRREGAILEADLMARTRKIQHVLDEIESRLPARVVSERNRIKKLLDGFNGLDSTRLEAEITLFADRVDVTEELVRLRAHVQLFEMTFLGVHEPIGKRLGFLLQEIHREITTLCNKSYDAPVMHLCMLIKEEVEKIREQCLNIR